MQGTPHFLFFFFLLEGDECLLALELFSIFVVFENGRIIRPHQGSIKKKKGTKTRPEEEEGEKEGEGRSLLHIVALFVVC